MADISLISSTALSLSNLILVTPGVNIGYQPQSKVNADGTLGEQPETILFNYEGEQAISLESDITDHFTEDNKALQDQISLKPEVITVNGYIGELNDVPPNKLFETAKFIANKLVAIGNYVPGLSASAIVAYNEAVFLYSSAKNLADSAVSAWNSISNTSSSQTVQTKQAQAFAKFFGYWKERTLFTVQTPWAILDNMAIKSLRAVQDADTRMITDFQITFKKINFATTRTVQQLPADNNRFNAQDAAEENLGTSNFELSPVSYAGSVAIV
jgi:hypothetical protein